MRRCDRLAAGQAPSLPEGASGARTSVCGSSPLTVATMVVLQFPPSESRSTDVIMLLRYGMCCRLPLIRSRSDTITISK